MTCNVFGGTLDLTQPTNSTSASSKTDLFLHEQLSLLSHTKFSQPHNSQFFSNKISSH